MSKHNAVLAQGIVFMKWPNGHEEEVREDGFRMDVGLRERSGAIRISRRKVQEESKHNEEEVGGEECRQ